MARIAPLNIDWKPDRTTGEPVAEQIVGYMCEQVHSGNWPIGSRLPSQRAQPQRQCDPVHDSDQSQSDRRHHERQTPA